MLRTRGSFLGSMDGLTSDGCMRNRCERLLLCVIREWRSRGVLPADWRKAMYYHYYEYPQPHHVYPHFGIRTERWVLVRFYGPGNFWELYDLRADAHELKNLYGDAKYRDMVITLKAQLQDFI